MDYRYETKDETRDFHKQRIAFIIYDNKIEFIKNNGMSHFEYCSSKGMTREEFNKITRGYYMNGNLMFYKDNFTYDDGVISEGLRFVDEIAKFCNIDSMKIYFGLIVDKSVTVWPPDYYYGEYIDGNIIKSPQITKTL